MKELDIIFSSLSRRLGIADDSPEAMALDVAKLEVLGLLMRAGGTATRPESIVKVRRGRGQGGGNSGQGGGNDAN
jgi:hypothetical protein